MNSSKTFQLLKTLEKQELVLLKKELLSKKRKTLPQLLDLSLKLMKQNKEVDFKQFFELFYKEKYNKANDNKLRNEFRIFNGILEHIIIQIQTNKKTKEDYYFGKKNYLEFLLERKALHQLNIELVKIFKKIDENNDYVFFHDFFMIWTKLSNLEIKMDAVFINEIKDKFKEYFEKWKIEVGLKTRKFELFNAFIERSYFMVSRTMEFTKESSAVNFQKFEQNNYFKYLSLRAASYKQTGEEKLATIKETIELLDILKVTDLDIKSEKYIAHQIAGIEHLIDSNTEKALDSFDKSLQFNENIATPILIKGLYNYASASIKIENYSKALGIYERYKEEILKSEIKDMFSCIFTMCYIFTNNINSAELTNKIISSNSSVGNYLYSRCNLAIIYYLNNESGLALNELININQTINYHKNQDKVFLDFISSFKIFINLSFSKSFIEENKPKLQKILDKLTNLMTKSDVYYGSDSLHIIWLVKEIESKISSQKK